MSKILVLSGRKQSGKSSAANFIVGHILKSKGIIHDFNLDENDGKLIVETLEPNLETNMYDKIGTKVDLDRYDNISAYMWIEQIVRPHIHLLSFADSLKTILIEMFGLTYNQCFGSNEDKDTLTNIKWEDMAKLVGYPKPHEELGEYLTAREMMECYGTKICRTLYPDIWLDHTIKQVQNSNSELVVITDGRFINEIEKIHDIEGYSIRFLRNPFDSKNEIESALDDYRYWSGIVDNTNTTLEEKNIMLLDVLNGLELI